MTESALPPAPPSPASPPRRPLARLNRVAAFAVLVVALAIVVLRSVVPDWLSGQRDALARAVGEALSQPVSIAELTVEWAGWRPRLHMRGVNVGVAENAPLLHLSQVDAILAWTSVLRGQPHFHQLVINAPDLVVARRADGVLEVAGMPLGGGPAGDGPLNWLLAQREIQIHGGTLRWRDAQRQAPELVLQQLALRLTHSWDKLQLGLQAQAPAVAGGPIDVRAEIGHASDLTLAQAERPLHVYVALTGANLAALYAWLEYPVALAGVGDVRIWASARGKTLEEIDARLNLGEVLLQLHEADIPLELAQLSGRARWRSSEAGMVGSLENVRFAFAQPRSAADMAQPASPVDGGALAGQTVFGPLSARFQWAPQVGGELRVDTIELEGLARMLASAPLTPELHTALRDAAPRGRLQAVQLRWQGALSALQDWQFDSQFAELGVNPYGKLPGWQDLAGEIRISPAAGRFVLTGNEHTQLHLPQVFPLGSLAFERLNARGGWHRDGPRVQVDLEQVEFANPDAAGQAHGRYIWVPGHKGEIDLTATLDWAQPDAVWKYLPSVVDEKTRHWVQHSIHGGRVNSAALRLLGPLEDFPFRDAQQGEFSVRVAVAGTQLNYDDAWPAIGGIDGVVQFRGPALEIAAERASVSGVTLQEVTATIADLGANGQQMLQIAGKAQGPSDGFLQFVANSPVYQYIHGVTEGLRADGNAALQLRIELPLHQPSRTAVAGALELDGNRFHWGADWPVVDRLKARLNFTQRSVEIPVARGEVFGAPFSLAGRTAADRTLHLQAEGGAQVAALQAWLDERFAARLTGAFNWSAGLEWADKVLKLDVHSDLRGLSVELPAPLAKAAEARWPLALGVQWQAGAVQVDGDIAERLKLFLTIPAANEASRPGWRGAVAVGTAQLPDLPASGAALAIRVPQLDADAWRQLGGAVSPPQTGNVPAVGTPATATLPQFTRLALETEELQLFNQRVRDVQLIAQTGAGGWQGRLRSAPAEGFFDWRPAGAGELRTRLQRLMLPLETSAEQTDSPEDEFAGDPLAAWIARIEAQAAQSEHWRKSLRQLPALDVVADDFQLNGRSLGRLSLQALNDAEGWNLQTLEVINPDGRFSGEGRWVPGGETRLKFAYDIAHIGHQLARFGFAEAVEGGRAHMAGDVAWHGTPVRLHYPSLSGQIELKAEQGQFRKLEPGVGRLLGVLSLQALPRRLTLDFRDVFSEGFAFDRISGSIDLDAGIMHTQGLEIVGPAARVALNGTVDLAAETQNLEVMVQPTLTESIAIGAAAGLINPVAGVVTYLAQKALSDPIEKIFSYVYVVSGTWSDPSVVKTASPVPANPSQVEQD